MEYSNVPTVTSVRRSFEITCALREGYKGNTRVASPKIAVKVIHDWMRARAEAGRPYLTGSVVEGLLLYTWKGATNGDDAPEPAIYFRGEVSVAYNADLTDGGVILLLNELADLLGEALHQTRVYIVYREKVWIRQAAGKFSPRVAEEKHAE